MVFARARRISGSRIRGFLGLVDNPLAQSWAARQAIPELREGANVQMSFKDLCETFDGYRFNTIFEQLGPTPFDIVTSQDIEDLRPRGIYNPVPTIIEFYAKHTLTGRMSLAPQDDQAMLDDPDAAMPDGDLWIKTSNPDLEQAIFKVWRDSNLQVTKSDLATNCATYGNCLLVINEYEETLLLPGMVQVEVCHPAIMEDYDFDHAGNLTYAKLVTREYERPEVGMKRQYTLTRIYTPEYFEVREDDKLIRRIPNPHGFVPVVLVKHSRVTQDVWGLNAFSHALPQIHELCLTASVLGTNIMMHQKPRWMIFGANAPAGGEEIEAKDEMWFFPNGSKADVMIPDLSIQDTYVHLNRILEQLEQIFPELKLNSVGDSKRDVSGAGVRGLLAGLIRKGIDAREKYEEGLKTALQMAVAMGQNLGGTGVNIFTGTPGEYMSDELDFEFHWPDIIPMNRLERLRIAAEEKTLELQIVTTEAQIQYTKEDPAYALGLGQPTGQVPDDGGAPKQGGNTPPPQTAPDSPSQGTPST